MTKAGQFAAARSGGVAQWAAGISLVALWILGGWSAAAALSAEARVRMEIAPDRQAPLTAQQEWARRLGNVGVRDVRFLAGDPDAKPKVESQGTADAPVYFVTGKIDSQGNLLLPGGRFSTSQAADVARWIADLGRRGPNPKAEPRPVLGLPAEQFQALHDALATPVNFSTKGMARSEAIRKIAAIPEVSIRRAEANQEDAEDDKVEEELQDIACGTALACVLRPAGLYLRPQATDDGRVRLVIAPAGRAAEIWPVGWKPKQREMEAFPGLHEELNANIDNVPLAKVLDVVGSRLKLPILLDHNALARYDIEPEKVRANAPQTRTTYSSLLRRVLAQAKLSGELRVDEAGKPVYWVTTQKPL